MESKNISQLNGEVKSDTQSGEANEPTHSPIVVTPSVQVVIHKRRFFNQVINSWTTWKTIDLLLFVSVGIVIGYLLFYTKTTPIKINNTSTNSKTAKSPSQTANQKTTTSTKASNQSSSTTDGSGGTASTAAKSSVSSTSSTAAVSVTYVTIPTGVNEAARNAAVLDGKYDSSLGVLPYNADGVGSEISSVTNDYAATAEGHYAYIDPSVDYNPTTENGGKLIYDGKTIIQSSNLVSYSEIISQNGLHYAYLTDDGTNYHIYIDDKLTSYKLSDDNGLVLYALSNDGQSIIYDYQDTNSNDILYKNGTVEEPLISLQSVAYSADVQHFIIDSFDANSNDFVIVNGKTVLPANSEDEIAMSENGLHYAYISNQSSNSVTINLTADGKNGGPITDPGNLGINDNGDYFYIDDGDSLLYINKKSIQLSSSAITDALASEVLLSVNNNASHYLVSDPAKNYYFLDGKVISLTGDIFETEFVNNTLYVYRFSS